MARRRVLTAIALLAGVLTIPGGGANAASCSWSVVPTAALDPGLNAQLFSVSAVSTSDIWAVGRTYQYIVTNGLAQHWDGSSWSVVPTPSPNGQETLFDVDVVASDAVWAVGASSTTSGDVPLVERWDGTQWAVVPGPTGSFGFTTVSALSDTNVWAGGYQALPDDEFVAVLEHWNGSGWTRVPLGTILPHASSFIYGIDARAANDVWAVGSAGANPLILHWNGRTWRTLPTAGPPGSSSGLSGIDARTATDAWAVGDAFSPAAGTTSTLAFRWNGVAWRRVSTPSPGTDSSFGGVSAVGRDDVWAVGGTGGYPFTTLTEHWNGTRWSVVDSADAGDTSTLADVAAIGRLDVWAVGESVNNSSALQSALAEHRC